MEKSELRAVLALVDHALWAGVLLPEALPTIATHLLTQGADTPKLRLLAGIDLDRFDPRDARDLFFESLSDLSIPEIPIAERVDSAAHALAVATTTGRLTTQASLNRFYRLAVAMEYPEDDDVMRLYGLDDEWVGTWGRAKAEVEAEVREIVTRIAARREHPPEFVLDAVVGVS